MQRLAVDLHWNAECKLHLALDAFDEVPEYWLCPPQGVVAAAHHAAGASGVMVPPRAASRLPSQCE